MKRDEELSALGQEQPLESLRAMRTAVPVEDPQTVAARRARLVPSLESQIIAESAARHRRARLRRALGVGSVAAGIALAVTLGLTLRQHAAHVTQTSSTPTSAKNASAPGLQGAGAHLVQAARASLRVQGQPEQTLGARSSAGLALSPGAELRTEPSGWLELELPSRARVEMSERSSLELDAIAAFSQELSLARGRIDVSVPKPQPGAAHRLLIVTPDSEVEVRGTVFSVEVKPSSAEPARLITEVFVSRGTVAVRHAGHEQLVNMGGHFSSDISPLGGDASVEAGASAAHGNAPDAEAPGASAKLPSGASSEPTAGREATTAREATAGRQAKPQSDGARDAARATSRSAAEVASSDAANDSTSRADDGADARANAIAQRSTLGQQNRLFEQALAARDRGDLEGAIALFDRLIARYPSSPLLGSVHTERARVLAKREAQKAH